MSPYTQPRPAAVKSKPKTWGSVPAAAAPAPVRGVDQRNFPTLGTEPPPPDVRLTETGQEAWQAPHQRLAMRGTPVRP